MSTSLSKLGDDGDPSTGPISKLPGPAPRPMTVEQPIPGRPAPTSAPRHRAPATEADHELTVRFTWPLATAVVAVAIGLVAVVLALAGDTTDAAMITVIAMALGVVVAVPVGIVALIRRRKS